MLIAARAIAMLLLGISGSGVFLPWSKLTDTIFSEYFNTTFHSLRNGLLLYINCIGVF